MILYEASNRSATPAYKRCKNGLCGQISVGNRFESGLRFLSGTCPLDRPSASITHGKRPAISKLQMPEARAANPEFEDVDKH